MQYTSGKPQVDAAVASKAWDVGIAGVVPNILGGSQGLLGIGICFDQSAINQLVATKEGFDMWPPASLDGVAIAVSPFSTGDYVVQSCLKRSGYSLDTINWVFEQQAGVIAAMEPGKNGTGPIAMYGGLWAPNTYGFLENNEGSGVICQGDSVRKSRSNHRDTFHAFFASGYIAYAWLLNPALFRVSQDYATVTGGFMVRDEFLEENRDVVVRTMAAWLRGIEFMKDTETNKNQIFDYMEEFYVEQGVQLSRSAMETDMRLNKLFGLDEQLALMKRSGDPPSSKYDFWTTDISDFMLKNGVVDSYPKPQDYITDEVFVAIRDDPVLAQFARFCKEDCGPSAATSPGWMNHVYLSLCLAWFFLRRG